MSENPAASQTLDRGLRILDLLADAPSALTIGEVAAGIGVHRSVAYRLVRTLEDRGLILRDDAGALRIGPHVATLARSVAADLQTAAAPVLRELADTLAMTAFLVVLDQEECVTLATAEPRAAVASIAQRPGARHPVTQGAPGIALQTLLSNPEESAEVTRARADGYATSSGEVIAGVSSVAAPVPGAYPAAIAVLYVTTADRGAVIARVRDAARTVARSQRMS
ncbi:MAG TPA: helix-turn-helix domain-containing protein [Pseudolysinimonas sp.]|nr:helix-turn-helix domain-containing protein [Pseudolysinimonas sp.]